MWKRLLSIILVKKAGLDKKWWNRLLNVFIWGSTVVFVFIALWLALNWGDTWKEYNYIGYSFEKNYISMPGKEINCRFFAFEYISPSIYCGNIKTATEFLNRYGMSDEIRGTVTDEQLLNALIKKGTLSDVSVKQTTTILIFKLFKNLFFAELFSILWFIFWETIIHRVLIYIILGNEKQS